MLDENKIDINDVNYHDNADNQPELLRDLNDQKLALLNLERMLESIKTKYGSEIEDGPDYDITNPVELGKPSIEDDENPTRNREATGLQAYPHSPNNDIRKILYNLTDDLREEIDLSIEKLKILRRLSKCGIRRKSQIQILKAEGYKGNDDEFKEFKKQRGKYKGFPLLDPNFKVTLDSSDNEFKVEKVDPDKVVRFTKENIDNFRNPFTNYDIFRRETELKDNSGNLVKDKHVNTEPKECLGFQPGDLILRFKNDIYYHTYKNDEAINLAFFGKDYYFAQSEFSSDKRKENPRNGWVKTPNTNLKFDEAFKAELDNGSLCCHYETLLSSNFGDMNEESLKSMQLRALQHKNFETELAGFKNRGSELAKKIYEGLEANKNGFTQAVFSELKNLVNLLDEAFGTVKPNTKNDLNNFVGSSDTNKKKALEIAKQVKKQESDTEDCVKTAVEKLKSPQENKLEEARQKLKDLLTDLKIGGQDAYETVVADIKNSETNLNKTSQIFEKLEEIRKASQDDNDGQNQGYADEMLKMLKDWAERRKKTHYDIQNSKNKAEFQVAKSEFVKKPEYRNNQSDYDNIYFPLLEKAVEIREKGNGANEDEKNLSQLMTVIMSDYNDWKEQLGDLENKLAKIKNYVEGGAKHNVIQSYSSTQKIALKELVNKMEKKFSE
nr:12633_t:CDS:2 [Entrophospora candida]